MAVVKSDRDLKFDTKKLSETENDLQLDPWKMQINLILKNMSVRIAAVVGGQQFQMRGPITEEGAAQI